MILEGFLSGSAKKESALPEVTSREREIVQLLAEGKSTKDVASILSLSVKTAETHRSNIMSKLGLHSVSEVVLYAVRNGIVRTSIPHAGETTAKNVISQDPHNPTSA